MCIKCYFCGSLFIICYLIRNVEGAEVVDNYCISNKCYHSVNNSYRSLIETLGELDNATSNAKFPKFLEDSIIRNITNKFKEVEEGAKRDITDLMTINKKIPELQKNYTGNKRVLDSLSDRLKTINVSSSFNELDDILNRIREKYNSLQNIVPLSQNVTTTCQGADTKYKDFIETISELSNDYRNAIELYDNAKNRAESLNKNLNNTFEKTTKSKEALEQMKIPEYIIENDMEKKLNESVDFIKNNEKILEELFKGLGNNDTDDDLQKAIEEVRKMITEIRNDLDVIRKSLEEYKEAIPDDRYDTIETPEILEQINSTRNKITELRNYNEKVMTKLEKDRKKIINRRNKIFRLIMNRIIEMRQEREKIKEYLLWLETIFSTEQLNKAIVEIKKARRTFDLINLKRQLEADLKDVKMWHDEMIKYECPFSSVDIEN